MQIPMPQTGPRGSPLAEKRHGSAAIIIAAATLMPSHTRIVLPFTVIEQPSFIGCALVIFEAICESISASSLSINP
jgi:hypothetical protein